MVVILNKGELDPFGKIVLGVWMVTMVPYWIWMFFFRDGSDGPRKIDWAFPIGCLILGVVVASTCKAAGFIE